MNKNILGVLLLLLSFPSWGGDFEKGLTAYDNGDYTTALREWTPLADRGHDKAQVNLAVMYLPHPCSRARQLSCTTLSWNDVPPWKWRCARFSNLI